MELAAADAGPAPTYDVLIPGDYFCDIVFTGLPQLPLLSSEIYATALNVVIGGGALNTAIGMERLGLKVGWVGRLGNDFFSQFVDQILGREQISTALVERLDQPLQRVTVALSYPADRAFVTYVDRLSGWLENTLNVLEQIQIRHLHFPGLVIDARVPALLDRCRQRGITVSMDCQHREQTIADPLVHEILSRLDMFMPNAHEALRLTQTAQIDQALTVLSDLVPYMIIKQGELGARSRCAGRDYQCPAVPVEVVDTTGAGDAFNAGFLAGYLQGQDPLTCLAWGNFCGSRSVMGIGGTQTAPTDADLQRWLANPDH